MTKIIIAIAITLSLSACGDDPFHLFKDRGQRMCEDQGGQQRIDNGVVTCAIP